METKFNLKDKVYFMQNNKVKEGYIKGIHITCSFFNLPEHENIKINDVLYDISCDYITISLRESYLFSTKEELIASL